MYKQLKTSQKLHSSQIPFDYYVFFCRNKQEISRKENSEWHFYKQLSAYDSFAWDFLFDILEVVEFPHLFISWLEQCATTAQKKI